MELKIERPDEWVEIEPDLLKRIVTEYVEQKLGRKVKGVLGPRALGTDSARVTLYHEDSQIVMEGRKARERREEQFHKAALNYRAADTLGAAHAYEELLKVIGLL